MNCVALDGRVSTEPRLINTGDDKYILKFTLASKRKTTEKDGDTDFLPCVAFGNLADKMQSRIYKGVKIAITGRLHRGKYTDKNGNDIYPIEIYIDDLEIVEHTKAYKESHKKYDDEYKITDEQIMDIAKFIELMGDDEELPFR